MPVYRFAPPLGHEQPGGVWIGQALGQLLYSLTAVKTIIFYMWFAAKNSGKHYFKSQRRRTVVKTLKHLCYIENFSMAIDGYLDLFIPPVPSHPLKNSSLRSKGLGIYIECKPEYRVRSRFREVGKQT